MQLYKGLPQYLTCYIYNTATHQLQIRDHSLELLSVLCVLRMVSANKAQKKRLQCKQEHVIFL